RDDAPSHGRRAPSGDLLHVPSHRVPRDRQGRARPARERMEPTARDGRDAPAVSLPRARHRLRAEVKGPPLLVRRGGHALPCGTGSEGPSDRKRAAGVFCPGGPEGTMMSGRSRARPRVPGVTCYRRHRGQVYRWTVSSASLKPALRGGRKTVAEVGNMTHGQRLAEYGMDRVEEDREALERAAAVVALTVVFLFAVLLPLGPLLY